MLNKPPTGLAAVGGANGSDDETIDDSLDEILLEARDKPLENPIPSDPELPEVVLPKSTAAQTLLGVPVASLPLPGLPTPLHAGQPALVEIRSADVEEDDDDDDERDTDAARPAVTDASDDEATKVEPLQAILRTATPKVEQDTVLVEQASLERDRALNRPAPPAPRMPTRPFGVRGPVEFADPEDEDDIVTASTATPGAIAIEEESIEDEEEEQQGQGQAAYAPAPNPYAPQPFAGARLPRPTPLGRPEPYATPRLPTPIPGFSPPPGSPAYGAPLPGTGYGHAPLPYVAGAAYGAPTPSPRFGAPGTGSGTSLPAVQIPPPSGAVARLGGSPLFRKIQLPLGGFVAFVVAVFGGGLLLGLVGLRGRASDAPAAPTAVNASAVAPVAPPAAVVVQPVVPAAAAPVTPAAPVAAAPHPTPAAAPRPAAAPAPAPAAAAEPPPPVAAVARPVRRAPAPAAARPARPRRTASAEPASGKPAGKKSSKEWVDPFAQ